MSSPRPWGCFQMPPSLPRRLLVFPTPVGVFPLSNSLGCFPSSLPHARGGVSGFLNVHALLCSSSPRPWGCFLELTDSPTRRPVFPKPVGVFPGIDGFPNTPPSLPHARGGVSLFAAFGFHLFKSSPRPWGCFQEWMSGTELMVVFPTPVGVFLLMISGIRKRLVKCIYIPETPCKILKPHQFYLWGLYGKPEPKTGVLASAY